MKEYNLENGIVRQYIGSQESITYIKNHSGIKEWKKHIEYHSDSLFIFDKIEYVLELISKSKRRFYIFKYKGNDEFKCKFDSYLNKTSFSSIFGKIFFEWLKTYGKEEKLFRIFDELLRTREIYFIKSEIGNHSCFDIKSLKLEKFEIQYYAGDFTIDLFSKDNIHLWFMCNRYNENGISISNTNRNEYSNIFFSTNYNDVVKKQQELVTNELEFIYKEIEIYENKKRELENILIKSVN